MKKNGSYLLIVSFFTLLIITACQMRVPFGAFGSANSTSSVIAVNTLIVSITPTSTPVPKNTPIPSTPTPSLADQAVQTVQAYFSALEEQDFKKASELISAFSLNTANLNPQDAYKSLSEQGIKGTRWSGLQVKESQVIDKQTILVHVLYKLTTKDPKTGQMTTVDVDELWPLRLESGRWLYNWGNLIDYHSMNSLDAQSAHGVMVQPKRLERYTDRMVFKFMAQNASNKPVVWGLAGETLGTFHFGDKSVDTENKQIILDRMQSYPDVNIEVKGLYPNYPDMVDLIKLKNTNDPPWYSFIIPKQGRQ